MTDAERVAYAALTGMAICFGGTWVAGAVAVDHVPPFMVATLRFAAASVLLAGWARLSGRGLASLRRGDLPLVVGLGLTAIAGYNWLFLTGLTLAPATDGAIIVPGLAPVFTALIAWGALREPLGRLGAAGLAVAAAGLVLVVGPGAESSPTRLLGDLMFIAGAVCWGIYSVLGRVASRTFDPVSATLYGTVVGTLVLIPAAILEGGMPRLLAAPLEAWVAIAYLAVFGTVIAFVLLHVGVGRISASRAAAFALLVPIIGVVSSALLLHEPLTWLSLVGGVVVIAGLWLIQQRGAPPHQATTD